MRNNSSRLSSDNSSWICPSPLANWGSIWLMALHCSPQSGSPSSPLVYNKVVEPDYPPESMVSLHRKGLKHILSENVWIHNSYVVVGSSWCHLRTLWIIFGLLKLSWDFFGQIILSHMLSRFHAATYTCCHKCCHTCQVLWCPESVEAGGV